MNFFPRPFFLGALFSALLFLSLTPKVFSYSVASEQENLFEKPDSRVVLARLRFDNQEDLEESRRLLELALATDPGNADYHFELSRIYGALYDESAKRSASGERRFLDLSQTKLEQVLMIRPEDIPAHYNLGVIYKRRGKMEQARASFYRVIQLAEKDPSGEMVSGSAWMQIGAVYEEQGFYEDARDAYMKAREIGGNRPEVQTALYDLSSKQAAERKTPPSRADAWTREYVSGADYAQFGADALRAQSQRAGIGALLPIAGQMLFQQFMARRAAKAAQNETGGLPPNGN